MNINYKSPTRSWISRLYEKVKRVYGETIRCISLRREIRYRRITRLVHFTQLSNLVGIFEQKGLRSRNYLNEYCNSNDNIQLDEYAKFNDSHRIDNRNSSLNLSVQNINILLLNRFHKKADYWCIIAIKPRIICKNNTCFSCGNAAANTSKQQGIGDTVTHFRNLFRDELKTGTFMEPRRIQRKAWMKPYHTTDIQAEVLVEDTVPISTFKHIYFKTQKELDYWKNELTSKNLMHRRYNKLFKVDPNQFGGRR